MTIMTEPTRTETMHALYCRLIGGSLALTFDRMYWWGQWLAKGWGEPELTLVIQSLQKRIRDGNRNIGCLKWSVLIQQADKFEEELVEAKALARNAKPAPGPKERVLEQFRPKAVETAPEGVTAKPIGYYIKQLRAAVEQNKGL